MIEIRAGNSRELEATRIREMEARGWIEVDEAATDISHLFTSPTAPGWRRSSVEALLPELRTTPVSLEGTFLEKAEVDSVVPSGQLYDGGYTGLTRLMIHRDLGRTTLTENEYALTGEKIHIYCVELREHFNDMPMVYEVSKAPNGAAKTLFLWFTLTHEYYLTLSVAALRSDPRYQQVRDLMDRLP